MFTYRYRDLAMIGVPYSRTHLQTLIAAGKFPRPTKAMNGLISWPKDAIDAWLAARLAV